MMAATLGIDLEGLPALYSTDGIPAEKKTIVQYWRLDHFFWLVAEAREDGLAFGYANLNDSWNAEWGYMDLNELVDMGALPVSNFKPCPYPEALERAEAEQARVRAILADLGVH